MNVAVSLSVILDTEADAAKVAETADSFARQVVGFALCGIESAMSCEPCSEDVVVFEPADDD